MTTTKQDGLAVEEAASRDLDALVEYSASRRYDSAGRLLTPQCRAAIRRDARVSNLGRFALAVAAGNDPEESAEIVRRSGGR